MLLRNTHQTGVKMDFRWVYQVTIQERQTLRGRHAFCPIRDSLSLLEIP